MVDKKKFAEAMAEMDRKYGEVMRKQEVEKKKAASAKKSGKKK